MATKNFVPRADLEGGIGTESKKWASGSFGRVNVSSYVSGSGASTASFGTYIGDGSQLTGIDSVTSTAIQNLKAGIVSSSVVSSPSQGTIRLATNGVNTDVDSGLQSGDSPTFAGITIQGNVSASGDIIAQNYIVKSSVTEVTTSFSSGSTVFGDTLNDTHLFTGSLNLTGSINTSNAVTASAFVGDGSQLTGITSGIFQTTASVESTTNDLQVTGSLKVNTAQTASTAIFTNNIQNGYPTSNNWGENLEGSYFNNFNNTTHVSEILRFIAGAMSHSLDVSDAAPNTKRYGSVTISHTEGSTTSKNALLNGVLGSTYENARLSKAWTGSAFIDTSETASYKAALDYLELKNFVQSSDRGTDNDDVGTNPFHGSYASRIPNTIQTQATFATNFFSASANTTGTTSVSSNANHFGLGTLNSGGARAYSVRVISSQSFSDNHDDQTPDASSTFHTKSFVDYTTNSFGTSNDGLTLSKIVTSQPAVIPSAFQDGDFNVGGKMIGRKYTGGATNAANISASGYYETHDIKVGLKSGSQSDFVFKDGTDSNTRFYLYTAGITTDITNSQPTAVVSQQLNRTAFSATSRSLSGAPYLLTTTYSFTFHSEVSKSFDPAHGYQSNILINSNPTDQWDTIGSTTLSNATTTVSNTGVSSTGATNYVWDSTKAIKRTSGEEPHISDIAVASSSFSFSLDSNIETIDQNRSSDESQNYNLIFRATGYNWKGTSVTSNSATQQFYNASLFGQSASSGSMAVYSRAQGYDTNTLQDTTETFVGEDFRIVVADNVQAFNGAYFTTDSFQTNDEGDGTLGRNDLQVKPGFLVDPTGSYGYWFTNHSLQESNAGYRYYIRRFQTDGGTKSSMTLNLSSKTLVNWNSTSNGIAAAILFESSGNGSGNNSSLGRARIYDPSATLSNLIEANISQDHFKNPFSTAIDLYGNSGGSISSGTYTIPIRNADGMFLDSSDNELYVIIRYKGDPAPISAITLSYS